MFGLQYTPKMRRRALRIQGCAATVGGTTNTNVVAFTGAVAAAQGTTASTIGTTNVAPVADSGNWINVVNDAAFGTTFKFNRYGVYQVAIMADSTIAYTAGAQVGITLDQLAAQYIAVGGTVANSVISDQNLAFWTQGDTVADVAIPCLAQSTVYITKAQAGGAQPTAAAGVQGVGVLRFTANDNNNGVIATALIVASIRATITQVNADLAG